MASSEIVAVSDKVQEAVGVFIFASEEKNKLDHEFRRLVSQEEELRQTLPELNVKIEDAERSIGRAVTIEALNVARAELNALNVQKNDYQCLLSNTTKARMDLSSPKRSAADALKSAYGAMVDVVEQEITAEISSTIVAYAPMFRKLLAARSMVRHPSSLDLGRLVREALGSGNWDLKSERSAIAKKLGVPECLE